jgi:hypothetical protein
MLTLFVNKKKFSFSIFFFGVLHVFNIKQHAHTHLFPYWKFFNVMSLTITSCCCCFFAALCVH